MVDNSRALDRVDGGAVAVGDDAGANWALTIVEIKRRVQAITQLYRDVMLRGTDYDTIPGTPKPTLLQPGAQLLDNLISASPTFEMLPDSIQDWDRGLFYYHYRCRLVHKSTGMVLGEGEGSCNSREPKYRWRYSKPVCPECQVEAIAVSKFGQGGFYCNKKAGGCGRTFRADDERIVGQKTGRVENTEPYEVVNTIQKMAEKRAHVAATLNATGASRIFTQDVEDLTPDVVEGEVVRQEPEREQATSASQQARATGAGAPKTSQPQTARLMCSDCEQPIPAFRTAKGTASPAAVAEATLKRYGRQLCHSCGEKEAARRQGQAHEAAVAGQAPAGPDEEEAF